MFMDIQMWVDADSLPAALRPVVLKVASKRCCGAFFVADRTIPAVASYIADDTCLLRRQSGLPKDEARTIKSKIRMIVVQSGPDSADNYIAENAPANSLCITHDIPLASRLLEKGCTVIDDRGGEYTGENIRTLLCGRLVNAELRTWGVFENQKKQGRENTKAFADCLDRTLTRLEKAEG